MRQQRGKGASRSQQARRKPSDAFAANEYPSYEAESPAESAGASAARLARRGMPTPPPAPGDTRAEPQTSGRHRTLIAAHRREASDPRQPVPPAGVDHFHAAPAGYGAGDALYDAPFEADGYPAYDEPDAPGLRGNHAWSDDGDTTSPTGPAPRRRTASNIIFDRETGLLPISLPALGARDVSETLLETSLAPVPLERGPRRHTIQRVTRAAVTGALVLTGLRPRESSATVIPGAAKITVRIPALPGKRVRLPRLASPAMLIAGCAALVLMVVLVGVTNQDGIIGPFAQGIWVGHDSVHALPTPIGGWWDPPIASDAPAAPSSTDPAHYVAKYGFDWPSLSGGISSGERQRLQDMLPFALAATARWDARFGDSLEPQMLLFWTHAEGIGARVSYSNCANEYSSFTYITSCDTPSFWQLGYGNQFSVIAILKTAFYDMRGDPNDPQAVQQVGQTVLDWDRTQGTSPACGGYSCTFPAMTIDQIMAGVSLNRWTTDDWWASVLSRDPAINCYMLARALVYFNHNATRYWVGCYYVEPCWSYESNSLGDILASWNTLRKAAGV